MATSRFLDDDLWTAAVAAGEDSDASSVGIELANAFADAYSRHHNPTVTAFESKFRAFEGSNAAVTVATASGMAAVSQTLLATLRAGDRLLVHRNIFFGVRALLDDYFAGLRIDVTTADLRDPDELARGLSTGPKAVYFETLSNPHLDAIDAPSVIAAAHRAGALVIIDNTLLTPCLYRPLDDGADFVIHSASKYICGHGDAIGGVVSVRDAQVGEQLAKARRLFGGILTPATAYLLWRGLKTLPLRIGRHCANALHVAQFLAADPRIGRVNYPGLPASPEHARAAAFTRAFGGLVSFELADRGALERFKGGLARIRTRYSFGELGTTILAQDWTDTIRLSVGLEEPETIVSDLRAALSA